MYKYQEKNKNYINTQYVVEYIYIYIYMHIFYKNNAKLYISKNLNCLPKGLTFVPSFLLFCHLPWSKLEA